MRRIKTTTDSGPNGAPDVKADLRESLRSSIPASSTASSGQSVTGNPSDGGAAPGGRGRRSYKRELQEIEAARSGEKEAAIKAGMNAYLAAWTELAKGSGADFTVMADKGREGTVVFGMLLLEKYSSASAYTEEIGFGIGVATMIGAAYFKKKMDQFAFERGAAVVGLTPNGSSNTVDASRPPGAGENDASPVAGAGAGS